MIIDCFTFYNELDILNYRLNVLNDVVDYFVIVEAKHTHVGKNKPLYFSENKHLFEKFNEKIILVVVDLPYKYPLNVHNNEQWNNERFQRNEISKGLQVIDLSLNDIIIISDLDEIPDPRKLDKIKNGELIVEFNSIELDLYYYNLRTRFIEKWYSSKILTYKKYKELNVSCNDIRITKAPSFISNCGWHLSYFGDINFIANKINNQAHQEFNNPYYKNLENIKYRINNNTDLYGRADDIYKVEKIELKDNANLPLYYETYLSKFV